MDLGSPIAPRLTGLRRTGPQRRSSGSSQLHRLAPKASHPRPIL